MTAFVVTGCSDDVEMTVASNELNKDDAAVQQLVQGQIDLTKVCSDVSITSATGTTLKGKKDCALLDTKPCTSQLMLGCYIPDPDAPIATSSSSTDSAESEGSPSTSSDADVVVVKASDLVAGNIKQGAKIGDVTGTYAPPAPPPACTTDGELGCVTNASVAAAVVAGIAGKVLTGNTIAGVAGTVSPANTCTADGQLGCVTSTDFKAVKSTNINAANIRVGTTIAGIGGTLGTCTAGSNSNCVATGSFKAIDPATIPTAALRSSEIILGRQGTMGNCSAGTTSGCYATGDFAAVDKTALPTNKIRVGTIILGQEGTLADCTNAANSGCVADGVFKAVDPANVPVAAMRSTETFLGKTGTLGDCNATTSTGCYATGNFETVDKTAIPADKIRVGTAILGVNGTLANCTNAANANCVAAGGFKAMDPNDLPLNKIENDTTILGKVGALAACTANATGRCVLPSDRTAVLTTDLKSEWIRSGESIGGVGGAYPSAAAKLPGAGTSPTALTGGINFTNSLKSTSTFEFWDAEGVRHTAAGTNLLVAENIKDTIDIFGVTGNFDGGAVTVDEWDLRKDQVVGAVTGKLVVGCGGAPCDGATNFLDISVDSNNTATSIECKEGSGTLDKDCMYKDRTTGLIWTDMQDLNLFYVDANAICDNMNTNSYGGKSTGWRLPTIYEATQVLAHGIATFDSRFRGVTGKFWSQSDSIHTSDTNPKKTGVIISSTEYKIGDYLKDSAKLDTVCVNAPPVAP